MALFCVQSGNPDRVYVFPEDTPDDGMPSGSDVRAFSLPSGLTSPVSMTIDGNDLYVADTTGDEVFVIPADTADGATAVVRDGLICRLG